MKRSAVWVCSTMLTILCVLFSIPATAQERDYCWVLVDIVDYDSSEAWKKANDHESYHNEVWYALGNFSVKRVFTGKAENGGPLRSCKVKGCALRPISVYRPLKCLPTRK
jgi:hypothetical protein